MRGSVDYRFLYVNPAFETITGLETKNIVGKTVREILPEIINDPLTGSLSMDLSPKAGRARLLNNIPTL
jgi:PAS domain S-box-containing protein